MKLANSLSKNSKQIHKDPKNKKITKIFLEKKFENQNLLFV